MSAPAPAFYALAFAFQLAWWAVLRRATSTAPWDIEWGTVATRPPWLHATRLRAVLRAQRALCMCLPVALGLGWLLAAHATARLGVAVLISLHHLAESALTSRHGEYPLLWTAWAMALPPPAAAAVSHGAVVHFILCAGLAKLRIGGTAWLRPDTMRHYLQLYGASRSRPPLSRRTNRWLVGHAWATAAISAATVALECGVAPATLLLPPADRWVAAAALVIMHVGIAAAMSFEARLPEHLPRRPALPRAPCPRPRPRRHPAPPRRLR